MEHGSPEILIVGGGAAGLTAALYAARAGRRVLVLDGGEGSQIFGAHKIENFPAFPSESGAAFMRLLTKQATDAGAVITYGEVTHAEKTAAGYTLTAGNKAHTAPVVILATGAKPRKGGAEGEDKFLGRGVSYCALCDGRFYKDKAVAVVGGGNSAVTEALYLAGIAREVTLLLRRDAFRAESRLVEEVKANKKVTILYNTLVKELHGEDAVEEMTLLDRISGKSEKRKVSAVFFAVGRVPATELFREALQTEEGFYRTDRLCRCLTSDGTPADGLYAVGDCRVTPLRQLVTAAADGAVAALHASENAFGQR